MCLLDWICSQKAKKKPIKKVTPKDLGVDTSPRIEIVSVEEPPVRQAGSIVPDVDTLIAKLKEGGHVKQKQYKLATSILFLMQILLERDISTKLCFVNDAQFRI